MEKKIRLYEIKNAVEKLVMEFRTYQEMHEWLREKRPEGGTFYVTTGPLPYPLTIKLHLTIIE